MGRTRRIPRPPLGGSDTIDTIGSRRAPLIHTLRVALQLTVLLSVPLDLLRGQTDQLGEPWRWALYTVEAGLPSNSIADLVETPGGELWVATGRGLAWYDQFRWRNMVAGEELPRESSFVIASDLDRELLVVTGGSLYRGGRRGFARMTPILQGEPVHVLEAAPLDVEGEYLIVSPSGLFRFANEALTPIPAPAGVDPASISRLRRTEGGHIWLAADNGTFLWTDEGWAPLLNLAVIESRTTPDGEVLFLGHEKIWSWRPAQTPIDTGWKETGNPTAIGVNRDGLVVATDHLGHVRVRRGASWETLPSTPPELLNPRFLRFDRVGDLWVGTDQGLYLYRSLTRWETWRLGESLPENQVNAILRTRDGTTWIGTNTGIAILQADEKIETITAIEGLSLRTITGLAEDIEGGIWVSSGRDFPGAYRYYRGRWRWYGPAEGLNAPRVHRIVKDRAGQLWFLGLGSRVGGPEPGAFRFDGTRFEPWGEPQGLLNGRVYAFAEGPDGELWFGTYKGLSRWRDGAWTHWSVEQGLRSRRVFTLAVSETGRAWFGHQGNGLGLGYIDDADRPQYLEVDDGLIHSDVMDLQFDSEGRLWISTAGGLSQYHDGAFSSFHRRTGLRNDLIWPVMPQTDRVYVGTVSSGLYALSLREAESPPPLVEVLPPLVYGRDVRIHWHAFAYRGEHPPNDIETRHRLDDGPWSGWSTARDVLVPELAPGAHSVTVQAKSLFGTISEGAGASFDVARPFYQRPLFLGIAGLWLATMVGLTGLHWRRRGQQRRQIEESEESQRALATRYQALLQAVPDLIFRIRRDGTYLDHAPAVTLSPYVPPEQFINKTIHETLPPEVAEQSMAAIERAMQTGEDQTIEYTLAGERGGQFEARIVRSGADEVVAIVRDVTRLRAIEAQLRQSQKMEALGHLSGGMAHDFNNLLTVIQANVDLISADLPPSEARLREQIHEVQQAANRGAALIRKLMAFSRREMLSFKSVDLAHVVSEFTATLRRLLPENIELEVVSREPLPPIQADPVIIEQIIVNLTTNARHAMAHGGRLRIETRLGWLDEKHRAERGWGEPGRYVVLSVSDNGSGMSEMILHRIFDPFFTTKPPGSGTGLGLPMAYGLMKQHKGFIDVVSEVDQGTTVLLYFPVSSHTAGTDEPISSPVSSRGGNETILVVEDEERIRSAMMRALERHGYIVLLAADGEEALDVLRGHRSEIALVISDIVMPKLGGLDLYHAARKEAMSVKFLLMSGYTSQDPRAAEAARSSVPFLQKPWSVSELLQSVRDVLEDGSPT